MMLRRIRRLHPDITIIFPEEKTQLTPQNFKSAIQGKTAIIKTEINTGMRQWDGNTLNAQVKQIKKIIRLEYHIIHSPETEDSFEAVIEEVLETSR